MIKHRASTGYRGQGKGPRGGGAPTSKAPLGENRFQELIQEGASAFFAAAERDVQAERAQAIADILRLMNTYGLTTEDLHD